MKPPSLISALTSSVFLLSQYVVTADPSGGCETATYDPTKDYFMRTTWNGREVRLTMPKRYDPRKPAPLVLVYHDREVSPEEMLKSTAMSNHEVNPEAIVVYPTAVGDEWLSDATFPMDKGMVRTGVLDTVDFQYTTDLLDHLQREHCVDKSRIFAAGLGTGGGMVNLLACHQGLSRRIAAFAAVSGAFYNDTSKDSPWRDCEFGRRPIPFMEIHGNSDQKWGYWPPGVEGMPQALGPAQWLAEWAKRNKCGALEGTPKPAKFSNATYITETRNGRISEGVEFAGGAVRVAYSCPKGRDADLRDQKELVLLHYSLKDVKYGWPRTELKEDRRIKVNGHEAFPPGEPEFDATKLILEWFTAHQLPDPAEIRRQAKELLAERGEEMKTTPKDDPKNEAEDADMGTANAGDKNSIDRERDEL